MLGPILQQQVKSLVWKQNKTKTYQVLIEVLFCVCLFWGGGGRRGEGRTEKEEGGPQREE